MARGPFPIRKDQEASSSREDDLKRDRERQLRPQDDETQQTGRPLRCRESNVSLKRFIRNFINVTVLCRFED